MYNHIVITSIILRHNFNLFPGLILKIQYSFKL